MMIEIITKKLKKDFCNQISSSLKINVCVVGRQTRFYIHTTKITNKKHFRAFDIYTYKRVYFSVHLLKRNSRASEQYIYFIHNNLNYHSNFKIS